MIDAVKKIDGGQFNGTSKTIATAKAFPCLTIYTFAVLEAKYGYRVRSRIKDMFNIVDITGKDLRV